MLHKVVPVKVKVWLNDPSKSLITWAYLDEGSEVSVCTTAFAKQLGAKLTSANAKMCTSNAVTRVNWKIDCMHVQGVDEPEIFQVQKTLVQNSIVNVDSSIPTDELTSLFPPLQDLTFSRLMSNQVELLLGQNMQNAFRVSELCYGENDQPFAFRTGLGWALWGNSGLTQDELTNSKVCVNFIRELDTTETSCRQVLEVLAQDFQDLSLPQSTCMSQEDKRALKIMEE